MTRKELARRITKALMQNSQKEQAVRLQLRGKYEKDMGGLCREAVEEVIESELKAAQRPVLLVMVADDDVCR